MKCEKCKNNDAKVYFTEIKNKQKTTINLCEECAKTYQSYIESPVLQYSMNDFIGNLMHLVTAKTTDEEQNITCAKCGISYHDFQTKERLGCAEDYKFFRKKLKALLLNIHGSNQHVGKIPYSLETEQQIQELKNKLQKLIKEEKYEEALEIKNSIQKLEEVYNDGIK